MSEPLSAEEERVLRRAFADGYAKDPSASVVYAREDIQRLLATLDAARATPAPDPALAGLREAVAAAIYDAMRENDPEGSGRPWVPGGNSEKQDEARRRAERALAATPTAPPSTEERE